MNKNKPLEYSEKKLSSLAIATASMESEEEELRSSQLNDEDLENIERERHGCCD